MEWFFTPYLRRKTHSQPGKNPTDGAATPKLVKWIHFSTRLSQNWIACFILSQNWITCFILRASNNGICTLSKHKSAVPIGKSRTSTSYNSDSKTVIRVPLFWRGVIKGISNGLEFQAKFSIFFRLKENFWEWIGGKIKYSTRNKI